MEPGVKKGLYGQLSKGSCKADSINKILKYWSKKLIEDFTQKILLSAR